MNKFILRNNMFEGRIWISECKIRYFMDALTVLEKNSEFNGFKIQELDPKYFKVQPPTEIEENEFLDPF